MTAWGAGVDLISNTDIKHVYARLVAYCELGMQLALNTESSR